MSIVADLSFARPGGAALKAAGFSGVMRYFSHDDGKNLSADELHDYQTNGLSVGAVWESTQYRPLDGRSAGIQDGKDCLAAANAIGFTGALYAAADFDASEAQQGVIDEYFAGFNSIVSTGRTGGYGGYWVVKRLFDAGLITFGWQTIAWSGSNRESRAHLLQDATTALGGQVDVNQVLKANYGQMGADATPGPISQPASASPGQEDGDYIVVPRDTLSGIAARFGTTYQALAVLNGIADPNKISVGQHIKIHDGTPAPVANGQTYTVARNDTLSGIGARYGVSYQAIQVANSIADPNKIYPGQVLRIPGTNVPSAAPAAGVVYIVQPNDTLSGIASKYGTNYQHLAQINGIADPNKIYPGQHINIS